MCSTLSLPYAGLGAYPPWAATAVRNPLIASIRVALHQIEHHALFSLFNASRKKSTLATWIKGIRFCRLQSHRRKWLVCRTFVELLWHTNGMKWLLNTQKSSSTHTHTPNERLEQHTTHEEMCTQQTEARERKQKNRLVSVEQQQRDTEAAVEAIEIY